MCQIGLAALATSMGWGEARAGGARWPEVHFGEVGVGLTRLSMGSYIARFVCEVWEHPGRDRETRSPLKWWGGSLLFGGEVGRLSGERMPG